MAAKRKKTTRKKATAAKRKKTTGDEVRGGRKKVEPRTRTRRLPGAAPGKKHRNVLDEDTKKLLAKQHKEMMAGGGPGAKAKELVAKSRVQAGRRVVVTGLMKVCKAIEALPTAEDGPYAKEIKGLHKVGVSIRKQCSED